MHCVNKRPGVRSVIGLMSLIQGCGRSYNEAWPLFSENGNYLAGTHRAVCITVNKLGGKVHVHVAVFFFFENHWLM